MRIITIVLLLNFVGILLCNSSEDKRYDKTNIVKDILTKKDTSEIVFYKTLIDSFSFEKYKVQEIYTGKIAKLDLFYYKDFRKDIIDNILLQYNSQKQPNFAGHYIIISLGCGSPCQMNSIIEAKTGKTVKFINTASGLGYKIDSYLLIENPPSSEIYDKDYRKIIGNPIFEIFDNNKLIKLNK